MIRTPDEQQLIDAIFAQGGGTQVSGDSGSGKSVFLLWLILTIARWTRFPVLLIDPKGDLAKAACRHLTRLGSSVARRVRYVAPGNTNVPQYPINPLTIEGADDLPEYVRRARQSCKVGHASHIVLASAGDEDFDQKPLLFKWVTRLLNTVADLKMPMAEVLHFLSTKSDLFPAFVSAVKDDLSRAEFDELASLRPEEREKLVASTKNRFLNMFDNPIVQTHFGMADVPSMRESIEEGHLILVDMESRGELREEDVSLFSNAWLHDAFHTVFNTPEEERRPFFVIADELPRLKPSFPLIASALRIIRGLQTRFIGAHQGPGSFPEGIDDPLLQTMTGQCGSHVWFRHHSEGEAMYYGRQCALFNYDPLKKKFEHWDREQFHARNEIWTLLNASFSESFSGSSSESEESGESAAANWTNASGLSLTATDGSSSNEGASATQSHSDQKHAARTEGDSDSANFTPSDRLRDSYGEAHNVAISRGDATTDGQSLARSRQRGRNHSNGAQVSGTQSGGGSMSRSREQSRSRMASWSRSASLSLNQTVVPVMEWRDVLRMIEFMSYDDQVTEHAAHIAQLRTGSAFLYIAGQSIEQIAVPLPRDPFSGAPNAAKKRMADFLGNLRTVPGYFPYQDILAYRERLVSELVRRVGGSMPTDDPGDDPFPQ